MENYCSFGKKVIFCSLLSRIVLAPQLLGYYRFYTVLKRATRGNETRAHQWPVKQCVSWTAFSNEQTHILQLVFYLLPELTSRPRTVLRKQWVWESRSLLCKKPGSHLDSCISLSRHTHKACQRYQPVKQCSVNCYSSGSGQGSKHWAETGI